jgi:hypothetical protein
MILSQVYSLNLTRDFLVGVCTGAGVQARAGWLPLGVFPGVVAGGTVAAYTG